MRRRATIFDRDAVRTDPGHKRPNEPTSAFYQRCSNPVIGEVRDLIETWYSHVPHGQSRNDLRGRLRASDGRQWDSAMWELYIHEALRLHGYEVDPFPPATSEGRRIDFLARRGSESMYVECMVVAHSDIGHLKRGWLAEIEDALNSSGVTDHWLAVFVRRVGTGPVDAERLVTGVWSWLAAGAAPDDEFRWRDDGWNLRIAAYPRSPEMRGRKDVRPVGVPPTAQDETPTWLAIRAQLEHKARQYGELGLPFVIAVNAPERWNDTEEESWGVLGAHPFTAAWQRDGFLLRDDGTTYPWVSGVLVGTAVQPHSVARCWPTFYENPHAEYPVPETFRWPRLRFVGDRPWFIPGIHVPDLFGVAHDWPSRPW